VRLACGSTGLLEHQFEMALLRSSPAVLFRLCQAKPFEAFAHGRIDGHAFTNVAKCHPFSVGKFPSLDLTDNWFHGAYGNCRINWGWAALGRLLSRVHFKPEDNTEERPCRRTCTLTIVPTRAISRLRAVGLRGKLRSGTSCRQSPTGMGTSY